MSFGSFEGEGVPRLNAEINTTPLVDVMLVLLVVFILTAPLLVQGIPVNLPQVSAAPLPSPAQVVELGVRADGSLFWNENPLSPTHLQATLMDAAQRQPQPEIRIRADAETPYRHLARVMAAAQSANLNRIGFLTQPEPKP
ncbi:biopolymer transporter ExbD [Azovibrio restrictus]|uniref:ExbD/TolR family protein n=1 Tax=Azovibrio restrictus TaxID=146938 RepID=UPI0026F1CAE9|nr:biopolymer transporter ExbD [Azovibrio restrictus]